MTTLLIVRHAEAEGNREHRFIGQSDVALSERGRHQAQHLARRLAATRMDRIVSSDLARAVHTVTPLATSLGLPIETDDRLREIANGEWAMLLAEEIEERWPDLWLRYADGEDILRPGGESWADVRRRVVEAVQDLAQPVDDDSTMLISTHAGPALSLLQWAAGIDSRGNVFRGPFGPIENASISILTFPGPRILAVNDTGHIPGGTA